MHGRGLWNLICTSYYKFIFFTKLIRTLVHFSFFILLQTALVLAGLVAVGWFFIIVGFGIEIDQL